MKTKPTAKALAALVASALIPALAQAGEESPHKLELKVRGVHFDRSFETSSRDRTQSALGLQLNYESPYFADAIGFGVSGFSVTRLASSGLVTTDVLSVGSDGEFHDTFGQIAQAFVKLKHRDLLELKLGRQLHDSMLLTSSNSRAVPNTYSGGSAVVTPMKELTLHGAIYDRWSRRAQSDFERFATDRSAQGAIDHVAVLGAEYKRGPIAVEFEYLNSKDFLTKMGLVGSYTFSLADKQKLKLTGGVHTSRDAGSLFISGSESAELDDEDRFPAGARSDNDGRGVYVDVDWSLGNLALGAALAKFDGAWIEDNFAGDHGMNPFPTGGVLADMTNNDETVWMVRASYNWKDYINGLRTTVKYKSGTGARNSHVGTLGRADENEFELDARYQIPLVKGLNLRYRYLRYTSDKVGRVDGVLEDNTDHRIYLDYTYRFF